MSNNLLKANKNNFKRGFTLVEIMISLAIFTVVALIAVGALLKTMDLNKKSIGLKTAINNLNFALESMSREMRMGTKYGCFASSQLEQSIDKNYIQGLCNLTLDTAWMIVFTSDNLSDDGACRLIYAYRFENSTLKKAQQSSCSDTILPTEFFGLISPDIKITRAVIQTPTQYYLKYYFLGYVGEKDKNKVDFSIQTSVVQRLKL